MVDDRRRRQVEGRHRRRGHASRSPTFWGGLVKEGVIDNQPMYTPAWNKALNTGKQIAWVSAVWAPGTLTTAAPETEGKWRMAPLPQWSAGENVTGSWGGSSTGVTTDSKNKEAAAKFAAWLNTDPEALAALVKEGGIYPAATSAPVQRRVHRAARLLLQPGRLLHHGRRDREDHGDRPRGARTCNVAYTTFKDALRRGRQEQVGLRCRPGRRCRTTRSPT